MGRTSHQHREHGNAHTRVIGRLIGTAAIVFLIGGLCGPVGATLRNPLRQSARTRAGDELAGSSKVTLQLENASAQTGQSVKVITRVVPRQQGRTVVLERKMARHWRDIARKITNSKGRAIFSLSFAQAGSFDLRAIVVANTVENMAQSRPAIEQVMAPPPPYAGTALSEGTSGAQVLALQQRLTQLGYWVGTPNGNFGDATQQAIYALQKSANLNPTGALNSATVAALVQGVQPATRSTSGYVIEINLKKDLVMVVDNGKIKYILNTSTGGGYTYVEQGVTDVATTPQGVFHIYRTVDGLVKDTLGLLWRPRFFDLGFAIHGDTYVPPEAVSHGCAWISIEAIDWIWSNNIAPIGTEVWGY